MNQPSLFDLTTSAETAPGADRPEPDLLVPLPSVRVIRSVKRRRTIQGRMVNGVLEVQIPARSTHSDEAAYVESMLRKHQRRNSASATDLTDRATALARRFDLPAPASIRWVTNMKFRWGSCTPVDGAIRINDRVGTFPDWVFDAVIVHEIAHLVHGDHSAAFWELANRYPMMERANGYLICAAGQTSGDAFDGA